MNITKALLADYANITREGKLNVLGIFTNILAPNFPAVHAAMQLIFMWEASPVEVGKKKKHVVIELWEEDGKKLLSLAGELPISKQQAGKRIEGNQIIPLPPLSFEKPGLYSFHILVNGESKAEAPFEVNLMPGAKK